MYVETCWFPIADVTNYQKLSVLKWHEFIILVFCGLDAWNDYYKTNVKVLEAQHSFWLQGKVLFLFSFQLLEATGIPWLVAPFFTFKVRHSNLYLHHPISFFWLWPSSFSLTKTLWLHWAHIKVPEWFPLLNLIISKVLSDM